MSLNVVAIQGRLGSDPDLKYLEPSGIPVARVNIAVDVYGGKGDDGKAKIRPCWVTIKAFEKTAQLLADHWKKGDQVLVTGSLDMDSWEKDGQKRTMLYVRASKVDFAGGKRGESNSPAEQEYASRPRTNPGEPDFDPDIPF